MADESGHSQAAPRASGSPAILVLAAAAVGVCFGAGDQYLGSLSDLGGWTATASLLSAPWLVLPFLVGCTQRRAGRAAVAGLVVTMAALAGYFIMIRSSFEGGHWTMNLNEARGLLTSNTRNIVGGVIVGPLYGFLGQRWRTRRAWLSAALAAGALCLEPFALTAVGRTSGGGSTTVWTIEVTVGLALAGYFAIAGTRYRRHGSTMASQNQRRAPSPAAR